MIHWLNSASGQAWGNLFGDFVQALEGGAGLGALYVLPRLLNCHQKGCWWLGRFRHGPYRLCHRHHPLVPSDGHITGDHIATLLPDPTAN